MLTFQQNDSSNESFFGHTAVLGGMGKGGGGGRRDDPAKVDQVVVIVVSAMYQFLERVFSQCSKLFWPGLRCRTTIVPLQTATTPFFYSGGHWQKRGITITNITNCFPCPSYVHDFVRQLKIHQAVIFNLSETCGQRQPRQRTACRSFHVSRFQRRYLTRKKKYFYTWMLGSNILQKQDV